jgi:hypothetical protein
LRSKNESSSEEAVYIRKMNVMHVPFKFRTAHVEAREDALIDSGAMENFIDEDTWERLKVGRRPMEKAIKLLNVDGTENKRGEMTHYCRLRVLYNGKEALQDFFITDLGRDRIILGYPFLSTFNPRIDWTNGRLRDGTLELQSVLYRQLDQMVEQWQRKAKQLGALEDDEAVYVKKMTTSQ